MRLLLYGDLHAANIYNFNVKRAKHVISEYSRIDELYSTLQWLSKITQEMSVMMPINMGDTFHQALRFYVERYNTVYRGVNAINAASLSKSGVIIKGNHDETDEVSAIVTFEGTAGTVLVNSSIKVKFISEINSHFIFVPYIRDPAKIKDAFKALSDKFRNSHTKVYVFCHLDIKEAYEGLIHSSYQLDQMNSYTELGLDSYTAVFSGHIHFNKKIFDNFHYVGSCLNHHFGDNLHRKGATIIDLTADGYKTTFVENPYCPFFVRFNIEKEDECKKKIKFIEEQIVKYPYTNIYARIFSMNNEEGRKLASAFTRDYNHLFTAYEIKSIDSKDELTAIDEFAAKIDQINVFDMIIEHGSKTLLSQSKTPDQIEKYITRLKKLCNVN